MDTGSIDKHALYLTYRTPRETAFRLVHLRLCEILDQFQDLGVPAEVILAHFLTVTALIEGDMEKKNMDFALMCAGEMRKDMGQLLAAEKENEAQAAPGYR